MDFVLFDCGDNLHIVWYNIWWVGYFDYEIGTVWTTSSHIITAVVGSGVLSLAWAMAQMGWVVGPAVMIFFSVVTLYTSALLADCYRSGDPVSGKRNYTFMDAVQTILGNKNSHLLWVIVPLLSYAFFFKIFKYEKTNRVVLSTPLTINLWSYSYKHFYFSNFLKIWFFLYVTWCFTVLSNDIWTFYITVGTYNPFYFFSVIILLIFFSSFLNKSWLKIGFTYIFFLW